MLGLPYSLGRRPAGRARRLRRSGFWIDLPFFLNLISTVPILLVEIDNVVARRLWDSDGM